jgi:hypothetical protein
MRLVVDIALVAFATVDVLAGRFISAQVVTGVIITALALAAARILLLAISSASGGMQAGLIVLGAGVTLTIATTAARIHANCRVVANASRLEPTRTTRGHVSLVAAGVAHTYDSCKSVIVLVLRVTCVFALPWVVLFFKFYFFGGWG